MAFGELVKQTRKSMNLTQTALGELVGLGKSSVCQYEKGKKLPRYQKLLQIAAVLNLDFQVLIQECLEHIRGFHWGKLGTKHELNYLPKYQNDYVLDRIVLQEMVPFANPGLPPGKYLWFIDDSFLNGVMPTSGQSVLLVQQHEDLCIPGHVVFHKIEEKTLLSGMLTEQQYVFVPGITNALALNEINLIGRVVQVFLNL